MPWSLWHHVAPAIGHHENFDEDFAFAHDWAPRVSNRASLRRTVRQIALARAKKIQIPLPGRLTIESSALFDLAPQPGSGERPDEIGLTGGDAKDFRGLRDGQTSEIT